MAITTEQIREIQGGLAARNPQWGTAPAALTAPNSAPSSASDGVDITISSGESALYTALAVVMGASVTAYEIRWWAYYAEIATWCVMGGSERSLGTSWTELIPSGPVSRLYCELTALTDGGSDGVVVRVGPCDPAV